MIYGAKITKYTPGIQGWINSHFFRHRQKRVYPRQNFGQIGLIHSVPFSVINESNPEGVILDVADK